MIIIDKKKRIFIAFFIAIIGFMLDNWSKGEILKQETLTTYNQIEITPFFNLVLVFNRGISFGMFAEHNQPLILTIISLIIIGILLFWLWNNSSILVSSAIGIIIGGAIGNVVDRIKIGAVVDFLDFHIADMHYPAFNLADSFVFIGVVILVFHSIFFENKK